MLPDTAILGLSATGSPHEVDELSFSRPDASYPLVMTLPGIFRATFRHYRPVLVSRSHPAQ
ncbi:hypothetical protein GCM10027360_63290 [Amycolatopsis echigonensis]